jgi:hypothetical protein
MSHDNSNPLEFISNPEPHRKYYIVSKNDRELTLEDHGPFDLQANTYLGCLVSADATTVYWENTTRPLP